MMMKRYGKDAILPDIFPEVDYIWHISVTETVPV
jgi:hypothetical protein